MPEIIMADTGEILNFCIPVRRITKTSPVNSPEPPAINAIINIVAAADVMRPREAALRPDRVAFPQGEVLYRLKKRSSRREMTKPEKTQPKVAAKAPGIPAVLSPANVEVLTASGPGVIWEMVIISVNSRSVSQCLKSTTRALMAGITA